jgi:arylsulfatase A-like enzyme
MSKRGNPNILIIWGDDIGTSNLSIFTKGMMGFSLRVPKLHVWSRRLEAAAPPLAKRQV